jgi:hypothetical protein
MKPIRSSKGSRSFPQLLTAATGTVLLVLLFAINLQSQPSSRQVTVTPSAADYAAAAATRNVKVHLRPANTPIGRKTSVAAISNSPAGTVTQNTAANSGGPRFPADLAYHGGQIVVSMQQVAIYMNPHGSCTIASCWGDPEGFLSDLGKSDFIHVVDQYTGSTANDRYTVSGTHVMINYKPSASPFTDADMLAIAHAVAVALGEPGGYGNEYTMCSCPQDRTSASTWVTRSVTRRMTPRRSSSALITAVPTSATSGTFCTASNPLRTIMVAVRGRELRMGSSPTPRITCSHTKYLKRSRTRMERRGGIASTTASLGKRSVTNAVSCYSPRLRCISIPATSPSTARAT